MILLAIIALIVIGPQRLPEIARTAGKWSRQARMAWRNLQTDLMTELDADHNRQIMEKAAQEESATNKAGEPSSDSPNDRPDAPNEQRERN